MTGLRGTKASIAKRRGVVLGHTSVKLHGGQRRKITVKLNAAGTRLLKCKGSLVVYFTATQAGANGTAPKLIRKMKLTLHARH